MDLLTKEKPFEYLKGKTTPGQPNPGNQSLKKIQSMCIVNLQTL
jgi:hypothetical protein